MIERIKQLMKDIKQFIKDTKKGCLKCDKEKTGEIFCKECLKKLTSNGITK